MPTPRTMFFVVAGLALTTPAFPQLGTNPNPNDPSSQNAISPEQTPSDNFTAAPRNVGKTARPETEEEVVEEASPAPKRCHWWSLSKQCREERGRGSLRPAR